MVVTRHQSGQNSPHYGRNPKDQIKPMNNRTLVSHAAPLLFAIASHAYAAPNDSSVTGAVTDSSGKPITNATVSVQNASGASVSETKTDAKGRFVTGSVTPGIYAIVVTAPGFASGNSIATTSAGAESSVSVTLAKSDALDVQVNAKRIDRCVRRKSSNDQDKRRRLR